MLLPPGEQALPHSPSDQDNQDNQEGEQSQGDDPTPLEGCPLLGGLTIRW